MRFNTFFTLIKLYFPKIIITLYNIPNIPKTFAHSTYIRHPRSTSTKVVLRTFLATLKQITDCIIDCQHDFEKGKHLQNIFK